MFSLRLPTTTSNQVGPSKATELRSLFLKKLIAAAVLGILALNVLRCMVRSGEWRSEDKLFRSALSVCPLNAKVRRTLGVIASILPSHWAEFSPAAAEWHSRT